MNPKVPLSLCWMPIVGCESIGFRIILMINSNEKGQFIPMDDFMSCL